MVAARLHDQFETHPKETQSISTAAYRVATISAAAYPCSYNQHSCVPVQLQSVQLRTCAATISTAAHPCSYNQYSCVPVQLQSVQLRTCAATISTAAYPCSYNQYSCVPVQLQSSVIYTLHIQVYWPKLP